MKRSIQVLLATYNGQDYVEALLESILAQTLDCEILVRDDGSIDGTRAVLSRYAQRLSILDDEFGNVGPRENFNLLLRASSAPYLALADQDDVWAADRLEAGMDIMIELEKRFGQEHPVLVHSDLRVCDANGDELYSSLWKFQRLDPSVKSFSRLLVQNNVTGCSALLNRALLDWALPVPQEAVMHDWWLALVASSVGAIGVVDRPLVHYRQHGRNQFGAVRSDCKGAVQRIVTMDPRVSLRASQGQAAVFQSRYANKRSLNSAVYVAEMYATIGHELYPKRLYRVLKHSFWKQDLLRNIGLIFFI